MIFLLMPYGLPWLGALMMILVGKTCERARYLLATISFTLTGIATLAVLIVTWREAIIGGFGMIAMALTALTGLWLSGYLIARARYGPGRKPGFFALLLLLLGGINSLTLTPSLILVILSWVVIVYATVRLLWFGGITDDVDADRKTRLRRDLDDFYDTH